MATTRKSTGRKTPPSKKTPARGAGTSTSRASATPKAPPAPPKLSLSTPEAAWQRFLPLATAIPTTDLEPCRVNPTLVLSNVRFALTSLLPHYHAIPNDLPNLSRDALFELPDLAQALLHASQRITEGATIKADLDRHLATVRRWREPMLQVAEVFGLLGLVPASRVAKIREGTGPYDAAQDGLALIALYREFDATLRQKHPFTAEHFAELLASSQWLVEHVVPAGGRAAARDTTARDGAVVRDQFWALVRARYADVIRVGYYYFGERVEEFIPLLRSRVVPSKPATPTDPTPNPA